MTNDGGGARFLTPNEVAELLQADGLPVTGDNVRSWLRDRKFDSVRLPNGKRLVRREVAESMRKAILDGVEPS